MISDTNLWKVKEESPPTQAASRQKTSAFSYKWQTPYMKATNKLIPKAALK